jgi:GNAT superfamily N-acetyltransferase
MIREINYLDFKEINLARELLIKSIPHCKNDINLSFSLLENPELMIKHKKEHDLIDSRLFGFFNENKLMGVSGLYSLEADSYEAYWVNWFAVDNCYIRKGIGTQMFKFLEEKVAEEKKAFLRVYTTLPELKGFWGKQADFYREELEDGSTYYYFQKEIDYI